LKIFFYLKIFFIIIVLEIIILYFFGVDFKNIFQFGNINIFLTSNPKYKKKGQNEYNGLYFDIQKYFADPVFWNPQI